MTLLTRTLENRHHILCKGDGWLDSGLSRCDRRNGCESTEGQRQATYPPPTFNRHCNLQRLLFRAGCPPQATGRDAGSCASFPRVGRSYYQGRVASLWSFTKLKKPHNFDRFRGPILGLAGLGHCFVHSIVWPEQASSRAHHSALVDLIGLPWTTT